MKQLALVLIAIGSLAGCVAVPFDNGRAYHDRDRHGVSHRADRDGDGIRNRNDHHPNNPRRH